MKTDDEDFLCNSDSVLVTCYSRKQMDGIQRPCHKLTALLLMATGYDVLVGTEHELHAACN